jgi:hypothetical protein
MKRVGGRIQPGDDCRLLEVAHRLRLMIDRNRSAHKLN